MKLKNLLDVPALNGKLPTHIKKAAQIKRICWLGKNADGKSRGDLGVAVTKSGKLYGFIWGVTYTLNEVKKDHKKNPDRVYIYIGMVERYKGDGKIEHEPIFSYIVEN